MPDIVFLVGMHRSGTSALTRVLSLCGGALPVRLLPSDAGNPSGYWEPLGAVELNDEELRARGSSWYDTRFDPQPAPPDGRLVERIVGFLSTGYTAPGPLLVKEPRITILLPAWLAAADALGVPVSLIHVVRDPFDVAASLAVRNHIGTEHALALWLRYTLAGERDGRGRRRLFVAYDDLLADWRAVVTRCTEALALPLAIGPNTEAAVAEHLSPALRHHRGTAPAGVETLDRELVAWAREAYGALRGVTAGSTSAEAGLDTLDALAARYRASPYAAGRPWPEPLAESAGFEAVSALPHGRSNGTVPLGLAEGVLDPHTAEVNRLRYQIEKQRYEREIAEREHAAELAKLREEIAAAAAARAELEAACTGLRARFAAADAEAADLRKIATALGGKATAASEQLYEALQRAQALQAELQLATASAWGAGDASAELAAAHARARELELTIERLERDAEHLRAQLADREALLAALQRSRSWRLTAPLRRARRALEP
jgi:hypothetical protein